MNYKVGLVERGGKKDSILLSCSDVCIVGSRIGFKSMALGGVFIFLLLPPSPLIASAYGIPGLG